MRYSFPMYSSSGAWASMRMAEAGDPWGALALAIVAQAALDYQAIYAYALLREERDHHAHGLGGLVEIERFFHSRWFSKLTSLDGDYLLRLLREKVEQEVLG